MGDAGHHNVVRQLARATTLEQLREASQQAASLVGAAYHRGVWRQDKSIHGRTITTTSLALQGVEDEVSTVVRQFFSSVETGENHGLQLPSVWQTDLTGSCGQKTIVGACVRVCPLQARSFCYAVAWSHARRVGSNVDLSDKLPQLQLLSLHIERASARLANTGGENAPGPSLTEAQTTLLSWLGKGMPEHLIPLLMGMTPVVFAQETEELLMALGAKSLEQAAMLAVL